MSRHFPPQKSHLKETLSSRGSRELPLCRSSSLGIWPCCSYGSDFAPGQGISTCHGCKKKRKKKEAVNTRAASTGVFFGLSLEARSAPFTCAATCCVPGRQRRSPGSVPLCPPHPPLSHAGATPQTLRFAAAPAGTEQKRCSCRERAPGLPPPLRSVLDASASPRMLHLERSRKISFQGDNVPCLWASLPSPEVRASSRAQTLGRHIEATES